jgi:NADPH2:quinone reductase
LLVLFTALGAKVIAAASSQTKLNVACQLGGADHGIDYTKLGWQKEIMRLTGNKGVDVIYDPVGMINGKYFDIALLGGSFLTWHRLP